MVTLGDLETYLMVRDYIEKEDMTADKIIESMDCEKVPLKVSHDGITNRFYSLAFAARYMGVPLPTLYYTHSKKSITKFRRKGGPKVFNIEWEI